MHYYENREFTYVMNVFGQGGDFAREVVPRLSILLDCPEDVW